MDLKLDTTGDLELSADVDLVLVTGAAAVAQNWAIRLRTFLGEWFLNLLEGMPFYQAIFVKAPILARVRSIYRKATLKTAGISGIDKMTLELNPTTRALAVDIKAKSDTGEPLDYSEEFIV